MSQRNDSGSSGSSGSGTGRHRQRHTTDTPGQGYTKPILEPLTLDGLSPSRLQYRRELMKTDDYLIEDILWKGTLNLIGGPSGVGKTTWLLPLLKDWSEGLPVLNGKASKPCPWVYVSSDRGLRETNRTLARLGLSDWDIPCWVVEEIMPVDSIDMLHVFERFPDRKSVV